MGTKEDSDKILKEVRDLDKAVDATIEKERHEKAITYKQLCEVVDKWLLIPDKNVLKILLATVVSHQFTTDPLWVFFVAPPSGSKTELISSIIDLEGVYLLSDLTPQTLASGMPGKEENDPSLLAKLKNNILVMKDFTTVLTMRYEHRQVILAQLREVYDGRYSKEFGTGKKVDWVGRLTLIAGVTPIIDTQSAIFQVMGERFIMYRIPQAQKKAMAKKALLSYGKEGQMRNELKEAMKNFFNSIKIPFVTDVELPEEILDALASLASFIVTARSPVIRDPYKKNLTFILETEAPARLAKQLGTLIKALAVLDGRIKVRWEDYYLTMRVAFDIIPANRMRHLIALCDEDFSLTTTKVAEKTKYSREGSEIILEDLTALEILIVKREGSGTANEWLISDMSHEYFKEMLPKNHKELLEVFTKESPYFTVIKRMIDGKPKFSSEELQDPLSDFTV